MPAFPPNSPRSGPAVMAAAVATPAVGALLAACLLLPAVSQAQGLRADEFGPGVSRAYVGASVGKSKFDPDCLPGLSCDKSKTAFKVFAGTVLNETFGAEFAYLNLGRINVAGGSQKAHGFNLSLTGHMPIGRDFSGFGKVGATYGWTETRSSVPGASTGDDNGLGISYGLGLGYKISAELEAILEYERHRFSFAPGSQTIGLTSIGLRFKY